MDQMEELNRIYRLRRLSLARILLQTDRIMTFLAFFFILILSLNVYSQKLPLKNWEHMTTQEFSNLNAKEIIAILPVASIEQHGPHLPVAADAYANRAVIERLQQKLPDYLPVTILPLIPIGKANEHSAFPGTLTLEPETLRRVWTEIAESVYRAGVRKLVLYNTHGGQPQIMDIVARDLRVRLGMLIIVVNQYTLYPTDLFPEDEMKFGIHGGSIETSLMLHIRPDLVHMENARDFKSNMAGLINEYKFLSATGPTRLAWQSQDLNSEGVVGNALDADAKRGGQLIDYATDQFIAILEEVNRYPLSNLKNGPLSNKQHD